MSIKPEREAEKPTIDPPIGEDTGIFLFGLLLLFLGGWGLVSGQAILVPPGQDARNPLIASVTGTGGRIAAIGLLLLGTALIIRWRWGLWTRWSRHLGIASGWLIVLGIVIAWLNGTN